MPWRKWPGALRGSNWRVERQVACSRTVNWQPTAIVEDPGPDLGGRTRMFYLQPTPGVTRLEDIPGDGEVRGMMAAGDNLYIVRDDALYRYTDARVMSRVGGAASISVSSAEPVTMAWLGPAAKLLAICANGELTYYDEEDDVLYRDVRSDTDSLIAVAEFQNYFVTLDEDNQIVASPLFGRVVSGDPAPADPAAFAYDLTNFAQRSLTPDPWVAILGLSDTLLLFGRRSMDVWQLKREPGTSFPFESILGTAHQTGAEHQRAVTAVGSTAYWVGRSIDGSLRAWRSRGGEIDIISNLAVDEWLARLTAAQVDGIRCIVTSYRGHSVFTIRPDSGSSWCYDASTGMWHERAVWLAATEQWSPWDVQAAQSFAGNVVVSTGRERFGFLSAETTDTGGTIRRMRVTPHLGDGGRVLRVSQVKATVGGGGGRIGVALSRDGGASFGNIRWRNPRRSAWTNTRTPDGSAAAERASAVDSVRWRMNGAGRDVAAMLVMDEGGGVVQDVWVDVYPQRA